MISRLLSALLVRLESLGVDTSSDKTQFDHHPEVRFGRLKIGRAHV